MCCSLPVPRSLADTFTIPLASISKVTSIWGIPRGAGAIPSSLNVPIDLLSLANSRSPCKMFISTEGWLSEYVENIWLCFVGMVLFLSIILVQTPPAVSIPSDRGVTSSSNRPVTSLLRTPPCRAAPIATHSSGLIPLKGSLPVYFLTASCTAGILVEPPTNSTLSISFIERPESLIACLKGPIVASTRSAVSSLNFALVS